MLWMELAEHGGDAPAGDGLVAAGAERAAHGVVMRLAVGQSAVLEEVAAHEGLLALGAHEAAGAPLLVQRRDVVLRDGLVAARAAWRVQLQEAVLQFKKGGETLSNRARVISLLALTFIRL